mmetsp:Transcript_84467/g.149469  ORF Transcript_84467/g.149469 Transcript_84467/m.149469 type:complete len:268 (-) Transcript_84467:1161-1964(-)
MSAIFLSASCASKARRSPVRSSSNRCFAVSFNALTRRCRLDPSNGSLACRSSSACEKTCNGGSGKHSSQGPAQFSRRHAHASKARTSSSQNIRAKGSTAVVIHETPARPGNQASSRLNGGSPSAPVCSEESSVCLPSAHVPSRPSCCWKALSSCLHAGSLRGSRSNKRQAGARALEGKDPWRCKYSFSRLQLSDSLSSSVVNVCHALCFPTGGSSGRRRLERRLEGLLLPLLSASGVSSSPLASVLPTLPLLQDESERGELRRASRP